MMIFRRMLVIVILAAVFSAVDGATLRQPGARMPEASPADVRAGDDARTPAAAPMSGIPSVSSPSSDASKNVPVTYSRLNTRGRSLSTMSMQTEWTPVFLPPTYPCDDMYDINEWLFIANHDVHGYDIGGRENSLQEAMTKCSDDNTCKAVSIVVASSIKKVDLLVLEEDLVSPSSLSFSLSILVGLGQLRWIQETHHQQRNHQSLGRRVWRMRGTLRQA